MKMPRNVRLRILRPAAMEQQGLAGKLSTSTSGLVDTVDTILYVLSNQTPPADHALDTTRKGWNLTGGQPGFEKQTDCSGVAGCGIHPEKAGNQCSRSEFHPSH